MCLSVAVNRPQDVLAVGFHAGYEWTIVHNTTGFRCGYVKVPVGHPWWGKGYDDIEVEVHGGLTFSDADVPCANGPADGGYWLGFDCCHRGDSPDPLLWTNKRFTWPEIFRGGEVRSQEYVEAECRSLCEQAARAI